MGVSCLDAGFEDRCGRTSPAACGLCCAVAGLVDSVTSGRLNTSARAGPTTSDFAEADAAELERVNQPSLACQFAGHATGQQDRFSQEQLDAAESGVAVDQVDPLRPDTQRSVDHPQLMVSVWFSTSIFQLQLCI